MADYSSHQKKIISRYYENRDEIMLQRLSELVSELYLAETDRRRDQLWERVAAAMRNLKVKESIAAHILEKRSPEVLAANLKEWTA
jgi:hypothetical protein